MDPKTKEIFADNLKQLLEVTGMTKRILARKSGVSLRMIYAILTGERSASMDTADALAKAFDLETWQMLIPGIATRLPSASSMRTLVDSYMHATDEGRDLIWMVAEREAAYRLHDDNP